MRLSKTNSVKNVRGCRFATWVFLFLLIEITQLQLISQLSPPDRNEAGPAAAVEKEFPRSLSSDLASFTFKKPKSTAISNQHRYIPSKIESYFLAHGKELGLGSDRRTSQGCTAWTNPNSPIAAELKAFRIELKVYHDLLATYLKGKNKKNRKDLRKEIIAREDYSICDSLELHPDGLKGIFPSQSLSQTWHSLLEPIFPPMRDPEFCFNYNAVLSMNYLIHDFAAYCRKLSPTSRIVLFDIGASLDFHIGGSQPAVYLTKIYEKLGFHFDHIYAYEITPQDPEQVVDTLPDTLAAAYHWINVGVDANPYSKRNPWRLLRQEYDENDFGELHLHVCPLLPLVCKYSQFVSPLLHWYRCSLPKSLVVIVKLDIDTPKVEMAMVQQLLSSPELLKLVDVFYFEHHVMLDELAHAWDYTMKGSVQSSLELFAELRRKGVDAHFWV